MPLRRARSSLAPIASMQYVCHQRLPTSSLLCPPANLLCPRPQRASRRSICAPWNTRHADEDTSLRPLSSSALLRCLAYTALLCPWPHVLSPRLAEARCHARSQLNVAVHTRALSRQQDGQRMRGASWQDGGCSRAVLGGCPVSVEMPTSLPGRSVERSKYSIKQSQSCRACCDCHCRQML